MLDRPRIVKNVSPVFEHFVSKFAVSFFLAGAVFGEAGSWHLLLRALCFICDEEKACESFCVAGALM